ncbi:MAG: TolC family protein [Bacteroidales bacterium]|jgi:outer membrane protein TolC|nr:TolC family protein [Bacteroidales bacterium]
MKNINLLKALLISAVITFFMMDSKAQSTITEELTFDEVVQLAREQSPDAIMAKHRFRASYWEFRTYKADYLPNLSLSTTFPEFSRAIKKYQNPDGTYSYVEDNLNSSTVNLNLRQNVGFTGGQIFATSNLTRLDEFGGDDINTSFLSTPISIGYRQPVMFYNEYKWQKKIEPLKFEEAKKEYVTSLENVALKAVSYFFDLALAQQNLQVAEVNYSNADTLYQIAEGRYHIGTIAENELMQMELSLLNAGSDLNAARVDLEIRKFQLRSFLGFNEKVNLQLIIPKEIPELTVEVEDALSKANENNPDILAFERQLIEAERDVAKAKSEKGLQADLFASIGYTQQSPEFSEVYVNPQDQQRFTLGLEVPILDWGLGRGRYKMAQSSQEVVKTTVEQAKTDFVQNVYLNVMQFNLQDDQVLIAAKSDTIAQKRYDMTKQRFLIGKVDVLDLNVALSEKDGAKTNYIAALRKYWSNYYTLRRITLYDFLKDQPLDADFDELIE